MAAADKGLQDFVAGAYKAHLDRAPDPQGLQYWSDALASGRLNQEQVANAIATSPEARITQAYKQELGRSGADDPGRGYWGKQVESGALTLDQALQAIAASPEAQQYDLRGAQTQTQTPSIDWEQRLLDQQAAFDKQMEEMRIQQQEQLAAQQRAIQMSQQMALQNKAISNAAQGQFAPTAPVSAGVVPNFSAIPSAGLPSTGTAAAPTAVAQPVQAITPTPAQFVPQTYLAPAPPQYRNVNPFQLPFSNPFESYYSIATRRQGPMAYPSPFTSLGQPVDGGQMAAPQGYPFQYTPVQQQAIPAPGTPGAPTIANPVLPPTT